MEKIVLPPNLSVISRSLFRDCISLSEVVFPTEVSDIEAFAFHHTGIKNIVLPDSINAAGEYNQEIKGETNVEIIPVSA